ncbi:hypothetical protein BSKO_11981 [Bryopsis sp. KO-2023]|nr:hypothetical protein BSKO_11981 [Bryopsis sp. KO-2023]
MEHPSSEPVVVTLEDLGGGGDLGGDPHGRDLQFDLGNLLAFDPAPVDPEPFETDMEAVCAQVASEITESLVAKLCSLSSHPDKEGRVLELPEPTHPAPRHKPMPKPKEMTRWESFAQRKGIQKRKKEKMVWDESVGEWRRRFGYKRVNDPNDIHVIEAKATDKVGDDPFTKMEEEVKGRVSRQHDRETKNVKTALKKGQRVPANVRLTTGLPEHGRGNPLKRKQLRKEMVEASLAAGLSTASMGKFDRQVRGEGDGERTHVSKKRKIVGAGAPAQEQALLSKMANKMVREKSDEVLDVGRAISKMEAEKRKQRHSQKLRNAIEGGSGEGKKKQKAGGDAKNRRSKAGRKKGKR